MAAAAVSAAHLHARMGPAGSAAFGAYPKSTPSPVSRRLQLLMAGVTAVVAVAALGSSLVMLFLLLDSGLVRMA